ncbi:ABC transporter substrate-binding protein [Nocardia ignorata]|uniref:Amino acid/amide ABC transporter substrate-binding protein (HAAT family) n=1 Tax=Nocardia ignorata TaxID=145285 RepID=A0A4R6P303_NOCIG|nr:ABC transporter substrate-binding protein [Nocardia ignorata]TDP31911.1 amino acid/amide ABC transporter substrate-binding protein (HAAT family) [Nocardia ignorata]
MDAGPTARSEAPLPRIEAGRPVLTIGVVVARSGRLSSLGDPLDFALAELTPHLRRLAPRGTRLRIVGRDSKSTADGARQAVTELVRDERARIVLTLAGTRVLPVVADTCDSLGSVCVSSTFPWQVHYYGRGDRPLKRAFHFCWGLDDIAEVFADLWERAAPDGPTVGCLWNDGPQGNWSRHHVHGFAPVARGRGHRLVDPTGYHEPATDFATHLRAFRDSGAELVTSAATTRDLTLFRSRAIEFGWHPRLITCSRWLAYPPTATCSGGEAGQDNVGTLVYWTPVHPYRSSLDGTTAAELADAYAQRTGRPWLQPLGLAYALFEVAFHALRAADDPTDPDAIANALHRTDIRTMAGRLDWTSGPVPGVAVVPLAGGQWQVTAGHAYDLAVITPGSVEGLRPTADLVVC